MEAVEHVEKIRVNPGNYADKKKFSVREYTDSEYDSELQRLHERHGILTQAWSPIGGITFYRGNNKSTLADPTILGIAREHGKSAAQVMLRWGLQEGRSVIPKSVNPARIAENFAVFDFELSANEIAAIDALDTGVRGGPDPDTISLENFSRPIPEA